MVSRRPSTDLQLTETNSCRKAYWGTSQIFSGLKIISPGNRSSGAAEVCTLSIPDLQLEVVAMCTWELTCDVFRTISVLWDVPGKAFSNIESSRTRGGNVKLSYYRPRANIQVHQFTVCAGSAYIPLRNALNRSSVSSVSFKVLALKGWVLTNF